MTKERRMLSSFGCNGGGLGGVSSAITIAGCAALTTLGCLELPPCNEVIVEELAGPMNDLRAIVITVGCSALDWPTPHVAVLARDDGVSDWRKGIAFTIEDAAPALQRMQVPSIRWLDEGALEITYDSASGSIHRQETDVHGVSIVYRTWTDADPRD